MENLNLNNENLNYTLYYFKYLVYIIYDYHQDGLTEIFIF